MRVGRGAVVGVVCAMPLALGACGGTSGSVAPTVTVTETVTAGSDAQTGDATPTDQSPTPSGAQATFGQTFTYADGLAVTVSSPAEYKPSQYAACDTAHAYVSFTLTVKNGTSSAYDPSVFSATVQSGQAEGSACFDSAKGYKGEPDTKLLPGRSVSWKVAYGVSDAKDMVMEVRPGFEFDSTLFAS